LNRRSWPVSTRLPWTGRYGNIPTDSNGSGLTIITQENTVHTQSSMQPRKKPDCSEDWGSESNN